jgi:cbb3-type cytochrome oxidase maturation protein
MSVILILIPIALLLALGFLYSFYWANNDGQFDDTYSPSIRILFDSESKKTDENQVPE